MQRLPWALGGPLIGLLLTGAPALAQPPRSGMCEGLTGDALTWSVKNPDRANFVRAWERTAAMVIMPMSHVWFRGR